MGKDRVAVVGIGQTKHQATRGDVSMAGLVLVTVLHTFPFVYLLASSALESIDASYEESAQILGAGKWRTAFQITAPLVAPAAARPPSCSALRSRR